MDPSVVRNTWEVVHEENIIMPILRPDLGFSPPDIVANIALLGKPPLVLSRRGLRKEKYPLMDGMFDALKFCLLEDAGARHWVVGALSVLEASDSQEEVVVRRWKPMISRRS